MPGQLRILLQKKINNDFGPKRFFKFFNMKKIIALALFISPLTLFSQGNGKIVMSEFSRHWIQSENECSGDTFVFRPEGHEKIAEAPMYLLYGGWTFFPEGQVQKHRWKKCGNDGEPPYKSGSWKKKGKMVKIKTGKEQTLFELIEVNKQILVVRDISPEK